ncbi:hypothetical protein HY485_05025, partial [Candidatus Woesearchaeota archaeon]|nr:hypothetical protein [Candidatus Woesearchaeota archaeon]
FKEFGDKLFERQDYDAALELYEKAKDAISSQEYCSKAEQILAASKQIEQNRTSWSSNTVFPTVRTAYAYLSIGSPQDAKQRIARYADELLEQEDFAEISSNTQQFWLIYDMLKMLMPSNKAFKAATKAEADKEYDLAAKFYSTAGMPDCAKRLGMNALKSNNDWQRYYGAVNAFAAAQDEEGTAIAKFINKHLR